MPAIDIDRALEVFAELSWEKGPTAREFQRGLGLSSSSLAHYRFTALEDEGLITQLRTRGGNGLACGWVLTEQGRARFEWLRGNVPATEPCSGFVPESPGNRLLQRVCGCGCHTGGG